MTGSRSALAPVALLLLGAFCGNAVAQPSQASRFLSLDVNDNGRQIKATVGEELDITLGTVGPGNYGTPQVSSPAVQYEDVELAWPVTPAGPTQIYVFQAAEEGQAEIRIPHLNSGPLVKPTFVVTIVVRPSPHGSRATTAWMKPDQGTTAAWTTAWTNLVNDARQTFTPSLPRLTALEVELVVANPGPSQAEVTLDVMDESGTILRSVSKSITVAECEHVRFVLAKGGLKVSPGKTYSIRLNDSMLFGWKYVVGGYKGGTAWFNNKALAGGRGEFLFRTLGAG